MNKTPRAGYWRTEAEQWTLVVPVGSGAETHNPAPVTHLLSLGSSITPEARKPWGSLWGDKKSLSPELGPVHLPLPPWLWPLQSHPYIPVTYHRTWGSSLACGSRTTLLTLEIRENTPGSGGLSPHYTPPTAFPLPNPSHCNSPLSLGAPADHQGQAFPPGLQDPQGLSFLGPRQHQGPPETHRESLSSKAEEETKEV